MTKLFLIILIPLAIPIWLAGAVCGFIRTSFMAGYLRTIYTLDKLVSR